jgi:hypothetical protein
MRLSLGEPSFQGTRTNLQNNQRKMDWRCGSNSRVPALQMQSPEIKHQSLQKKKNNNNTNKCGDKLSRVSGE